MGKTATLLLKHRPTDDRCAEIASRVAEELRVPSGVISWEISEEIPDGYSVHLTDQMEAFKRDAPGNPVYLTVTVQTVE